VLPAGEMSFWVIFCADSRAPQPRPREVP